MKILFLHQNFPGQFKHLAPALATHHEVVALHVNPCPPIAGVKTFAYKIGRGTSPNIHPWVSDFETKVIRAEAAAYAASQLKQQGFYPDLIIAHPGWGESLFIKDVWPDATLVMYSEFFYLTQGADVGFDPEFVSKDTASASRLRLKNANHVLHFQSADAGISPTHWQRSVFPEPFRSKIKVIHDGIDTELLAPKSDANITLNSNAGEIKLTRNDKIITFVNRNLEPYRGYHIFMRALPAIMRQCPDARILIVGGDEVSYGSRAPEGQTWKNIFLSEVKDQLDMNRVHFLGKIAYPHFISLLQLSTVHVYLTYPFVLSWSLLEAMSTGCAIVASDTEPVREAIQHNKTGKLVNFFDHVTLAKTVSELVENKAEREKLGAAARKFAQSHYDLKKHCLPAQLKWIESLLKDVSKHKKK